jgi:hypothetical protein
MIIYLKEFVFVAKVAMIQWKKCRKSGDYPFPDLAKSGYKNQK